MKILFVCMAQYGKLVDTYMYCQQMKQKNQVSYLCWDYGYSKIEEEDLEIIYVQRTGSIVARYFRYLKAAINQIRLGKYDICHITNFIGCTVLKILNRKTVFIYDIRSGSINANMLKRTLRDGLRILESYYFKNVTVISSGLAKKFKIHRRSVVISVGSVKKTKHMKEFSKFKILYIGTLFNRRIQDTVVAVARMRSKLKEIEKYTIITHSPRSEIEFLNNVIVKANATSFIEIVGEVQYSKLGSYLEEHNVGMAYIPINPYYDLQPPTKLFDYMLSGLAVIATATTENKRLVNDSNGVLVEDSVDGICKGLRYLTEKKRKFNSTAIEESVKDYTWQLLAAKLYKYMQNCIAKENTHQ